MVPLALDVTLEGRSEDGVELRDVVLEAYQVTVERKHVVNTFVFETVDIYRLVVWKLDEFANVVLVGSYKKVLLT